MEQLSSEYSLGSWISETAVLDLLNGAKSTGVLWSCVPNKSFCWVGSACQEEEIITSMPNTFPEKTF